MMRINPFVKRFSKFAIVGGSGMLVNMSILYLLHDLAGIELAYASPPAIVVAIFNNFNWNNFWTWRSSEQKTGKSYSVRLINYYSAAILGAIANYSTLMLLVEMTTIPYLIANLFGILAGMSSNYLLSEFWIFKIRKVAEE